MHFQIGFKRYIGIKCISHSVSSQCIQNRIKIRRLVTTNAEYIKYSMCRVINRFQYRKVCQEDMRNDKKSSRIIYLNLIRNR